MSPHVRRMITEIIQIFPNRISETEMAERLGMRQSWLQKICRKTFSISFQRLRRFIRLYKALRMMKHTNLDNTEIALQLNYSDESNRLCCVSIFPMTPWIPTIRRGRSGTISSTPKMEGKSSSTTSLPSQTDNSFDQFIMVGE